MKNVFRQATESKTLTNKYEKLGFTRNPFPVDPAVKRVSNNDLENGSLYLELLRKDEQKTFEDLLIPSPQRVSDKKIVLLMDYATFRGRGIGKTAFLNHQLHRINTDLGYELSEGKEVMFALHLTPGGEKKERKFWQISKLIWDVLIEQDLLLLAICRLRVFSGIIPQSLIDTTENNLSETIANNSWLEKNSVSISELNKKIINSLKENGVSEFFQRLVEDPISNLGTIFQDKTDFFWRNKANDIVFNDIVKFLAQAGFTKILLLFDESEKVITAQNVQERRSFCESIRYYFIDGANGNVKFELFKLLLTIHPYSQELLSPHWNAAGLNRFAELGGEMARHNTVFFNPLNKENSIPLAALYLQHSRITKSKINDDVSPFDNESLILALEKTEGIPGRFLQLLYQAIEMAVNNTWTHISKLEIDQVIKSGLILKKESDTETQTLPETITKLSENE